MFAWFLHRAGSLRADLGGLERTVHSPHRKRTSFYHRVLLPLFQQLNLDVASSTCGVDVPDEALASVFDFLNSFEWILDEDQADRPSTITPAILGFLLERYVNQQQMGAYYTPGDVTGFIAQQSILACLLDTIENKHPGALKRFTSCWRRLRREPDRYLHSSMRHGVDDALPGRIALGIRDPTERQAWDEPAPARFGLATETWREYLARREHCRDLRRRLSRGGISSVEALIACNVDLPRFTIDAIESCADAELLRTIHGVLVNLAVIDPACGSGAFLVAAVNVLTPLYRACLDRMAVLLQHGPVGRATRAAFRRWLQEASPPPRRLAFMVRSVIENNLHGMDLMPEAVEVCKMRMLLELARALPGEDWKSLSTLRCNVLAGDSLAPGTLTRAYDVVIGNPPYVEMQARNGWDGHYHLSDTGNLFAICTERFAQLVRPGGRLGVIVPISSVSTPRMRPLMRLLVRNFHPVHIANFAVRPCKLFVGVDMNLSIILASKAEASSPQIWTTAYRRWQPAYRPYLFRTLQFSAGCFHEAWSTFPKVGTAIERAILAKLRSCRAVDVLAAQGPGTANLYCHSGGRYFRKCVRAPLSREYKPICVPADWVEPLVCLLSSSLFYWFWLVVSDCYHLTRRDLAAMPIAASLVHDERFQQLAKQLSADQWTHAVRRKRVRADGSHQEEVNFDMGRCRHVLDAIDRVLAEHYGLTAEETDFILSYDGKFRGGAPS